VGTDIVAFIEFDEDWLDWERWGKARGEELRQPFAGGNSIQSLTHGGSLYTGSKDHLFFGAIAGVRNQTGRPPLYPLRGSPTSLSWRVTRAIHDTGYEWAGWLTLSEINAALDHHGVDRDRVSDEILNLLDVMEILERRYGESRVRLLFYFD
jgi:hypothetical protein